MTYVSPILRSANCFICLFFIGMVGQVTADSVKSAQQLREQSQREAIASQRRIDAMAQEAQQLLDRYRTVTREIETKRAYNDHLARMVEAQQKQLTALKRQIEDTQQLQYRIIPLLMRMVEVLEEVVKLDIPFLLQERRERLKTLRQLIDDPLVSIPDKTRQVMDAFRVEMEYGRNIESYQGEIEQNGRTLTVDFLRIGRIALIYRTFDGSQVGYWDPSSNAWVTLPSGYLQSIEQGLRIARKEAPPDLISVPLPVPQAVR
jgi:Protein of unknown function (DUF3450)